MENIWKQQAMIINYLLFYWESTPYNIFKISSLSNLIFKFKNQNSRLKEIQISPLDNLNKKCENDRQGMT